MQARQGEFSTLFLDPVLTGDGVHPQPPLDHQALSDLDTVLKVLRKTSPADNLQLARRIIGAKTIELNSHLRHRSLVVLGVAHLGRLQHFNLQQAMVHRTGQRQGATS